MEINNPNRVKVVRREVFVHRDKINAFCQLVIKREIFIINLSLINDVMFFSSIFSFLTSIS